MNQINYSHTYNHSITVAGQKGGWVRNNLTSVGWPLKVCDLRGETVASVTCTVFGIPEKASPVSCHVSADFSPADSVALSRKCLS